MSRIFFFAFDSQKQRALSRPNFVSYSARSLRSSVSSKWIANFLIIFIGTLIGYKSLRTLQTLQKWIQTHFLFQYLMDGISQPLNGMSQLLNGISQLLNGISQLLNGISKLLNGMSNPSRFFSFLCFLSLLIILISHWNSGNGSSP